MTNNNRSRKGSLQFYPRVRAKKVIPSVNWDAHNSKDVNFLGFIGYKVAMISAFVKDDTPDSMTKGKKITIPATIVECPSAKIYSVRFYDKQKKILKETIVNIDKILKRKVKLAKTAGKLEAPETYDDVRVLLYSDVGTTNIGKKKPDMVEIGLSGSNEEKIAFITERIGKSISISEVFNSKVVDIHAVTKGYGTQGPMKRFGIHLKSHKSEKGRRRPGSLSSFGLRRVTFRAPQAGQTGFHNRITYNNVVLDSGKISEKDINPKAGFRRYGKINTEYLLLQGSIPGPKRRGMVLTVPQRISKKQAKKQYEVISLR